MSKAALIVLMGCIMGVVANAADPLTTATKSSPDQELGEILVDGRKPVTDKRQLIAWIQRLVGRFSYEGYVERYGVDGVASRAEVEGGSWCVRFDEAIAVQCLVNVSWPAMPQAGGDDPVDVSSSLTPAVVVYGLGAPKTYFGYQQVDSNGVATVGKGQLIDDTLISRDPCADFPDCLRVLRLQAPAPDGEVIRMRMDLEQKGKLRLRYEFQWNRLTAVQAAEAAAAAAAMPAESSPPLIAAPVQVPPDIETWLRRLVGQYRIPGVDESCAALEIELASRPDAAAANEAVRCPKSKEEKAALKDRPADAQCQSIGTGPGVRCVLYMAWPESGSRFDRKWYMSLNPSLVMFGFDPVQRGVALVQVFPNSAVGPAYFTAGGLKNGKLNYLMDCSRPPCYGVEQWSIAPGGEWVQLQGSLGSGLPTFVSFQMFRMHEQDGASGKAVVAPKARRSNPSPRRP